MSIDEELVETLAIKPGMVIGGKYRVEHLLAAGGMGAVLKAHHEILDKPVAIKMIRPELATRRDVAQRFLREARAAAKIASDNVARVTDVDMFDDRTPFMVMEFLEGEDLHDYLVGQGSLPIALAIDFAIQALIGLDAAHSKGVVHRDLKPSNLFLERREDGSRRVKLLDFGISKIVDSEDAALKAGATTSAGQMLGTPRYMSPEQVANAKTVDGRTDLWAIALILYEMLTGSYPFDGGSSGQILANILTNAVPPLRDRREDAPEALEEALDRGLRKDREQRFRTSRQMIQALAPFASRRMQAIAGEYEEIAGEPIPTVKSPNLDGPNSPTRDSNPSPTPNSANKSRSVALKATEVAGDAKDGVATRISGGGDKVTKTAAETPTAGAKSPAPNAPPAMSTETGISSELKPPSQSGWKIGAVALVAAALAGGVWFVTRDPGKTATPANSLAATEPTTTSVTSASKDASQAATVTATAPTVEVVTTSATTSASADTSAVAAPSESTPAAKTAARPPTTAKAKPSAQPTATATSTGGMIRIRD